jgi:hypothetical protein
LPGQSGEKFRHWIPSLPEIFRQKWMPLSRQNFGKTCDHLNSAFVLTSDEKACILHGRLEIFAQGRFSVTDVTGDSEKSRSS